MSGWSGGRGGECDGGGGGVQYVQYRCSNKKVFPSRIFEKFLEVDMTLSSFSGVGKP